MRDAIAVALELIVRGIIGHKGVELAFPQRTIKCQVKLSKECPNG